VDVDSVAGVLWQRLSQLAGAPDVWVMIRRAGNSESRWVNLLRPDVSHRMLDVDNRRELAAEEAIVMQSDSRQERDGIELEGQIVFPMMVGGKAIGVLGLPARLRSSSFGEAGSSPIADGRWPIADRRNLSNAR